MAGAELADGAGAAADTTADTADVTGAAADATGAGTAGAEVADGAGAGDGAGPERREPGRREPRWPTGPEPELRWPGPS